MKRLARVLTEYGMLVVLVLLCLFLTFATWGEQWPQGESAGRQVAQRASAAGQRQQAVIVALNTSVEQTFVEAAARELAGSPVVVLAKVQGQPADARQAIERLLAKNQVVDVVLCSSATADWNVFARLKTAHQELTHMQVVAPESYYWSNFLKSSNLLNVTNQIAVIAIIAVGMTMVIITRGIDLSVGSLVALSAVVIARVIRDYGGAEQASTVNVVLAGAVAIGVCALAGLFNGAMVTLFRSPPNIPPFIVTLAMMLIASGAAYMIGEGQSINRVPDSFTWLGTGSTGAKLAAIPNAVILMFVVYGIAHWMMSRTMLGRYIYAVGGNPEASRLSGISVRRVLLFVYTLSGALAGLGGVMLASQLKAGAPTYGIMYELTVIAAVVVGGTSLAGGEGRVLGTLVGALIIAVIQNGMNLLGLESYTQKIVLGSVILLAVLADRLKRQFI